jgi:hypothetical protein
VLLLRTTDACGCRRLHLLVLVLTKEVPCPYAFGAVMLIHQEDTADSKDYVLIPLHRRPPDTVLRAKDNITLAPAASPSWTPWPHTVATPVGPPLEFFWCRGPEICVCFGMFFVGPEIPCTGEQSAHQHTHTHTTARGRRRGQNREHTSTALHKSETLNVCCSELKFLFP